MRVTRPGRCLFIAATLLHQSKREVVQGSDSRGLWARLPQVFPRLGIVAI